MLWIIEIRILELPKWPLSKVRCHSADDAGHCCPLAFYAAARCGHKGSLDDVVGGSGGEGMGGRTQSHYFVKEMFCSLIEMERLQC